MTYWVVSLALILFGFLGGFSIGRPFLLLGLTMLLLGPLRHHPRGYWPPMSAVIGFIVGYAAVAPFSCMASQSIGDISRTVCTSLIGVRYEGTGIYNPSLVPGAVAGLLLAAATASAVWLLIRTRRIIPDR